MPKGTKYSSPEKVIGAPPDNQPGKGFKPGYEIKGSKKNKPSPK